MDSNVECIQNIKTIRMKYDLLFLSIISIWLVVK